MAAGVRLTKDYIDDVLGQALLDVHTALTKVEAIRDNFVQPRSDAELEALGYTPAEVAQLKAAFDDMDTLWKIYRGGALPPASVDFRRNAKKLWGLGI